MPHWAAMPAPIGTSATMVPTLVPMAIEMKQAVTNRPDSSQRGGTAPSISDTVASTAPSCRAVCAKAPDSRKIQIISSTLGCPAPRENAARRSASGPRVTATPYAPATRNAAETGTL